MFARTLNGPLRNQVCFQRGLTRQVCLRMSSSLHHLPSPEEENARFAADVKAVQDWWDKERFKGIRRTYTAEDVVKKRGTLRQEYPSSHQAKKLFGLLTERSANGE